MPRKLSDSPKALYQRVWRAEHPEKVKEYSKRARAKHGAYVMTTEQRMAHNVRQKEYANRKYNEDEEYREKKKAESRAYYYAHMEQCKAYQAEYRKLQKELNNDTMGEI